MGTEEPRFGCSRLDDLRAWPRAWCRQPQGPRPVPQIADVNGRFRSSKYNRGCRSVGDDVARTIRCEVGVTREMQVPARDMFVSSASVHRSVELTRQQARRLSALDPACTAVVRRRPPWYFHGWSADPTMAFPSGETGTPTLRATAE